MNRILSLFSAITHWVLRRKKHQYSTNGQRIKQHDKAISVNPIRCIKSTECGIPPVIAHGDVTTKRNIDQYYSLYTKLIRPKFIRRLEKLPIKKLSSVLTR